LCEPKKCELAGVVNTMRTVNLHIRLTQAEREMLLALAEREGESVSCVARRAFKQAFGSPQAAPRDGLPGEAG
jgi:hypothetical protein